MSETITTTNTAGLQATAPRATARRSPAGATLHWFGMLCLMVAAGLGGYVAWLLWGTGLETSRAQDALRTEFAAVVEAPVPIEEAVTAPPVPLGDAYAQITIPTIGVNFMVVQGTDYDDLKKGPGHYSDTADPWDDSGRVAIAGHRTTYLAPFFKLDKLADGDRINLRTEYGTFRYEIRRVFVIPSAGSGRVLTQTDAPTLVLTTCNPVYAAYERLIVTAVRVGGPEV
jgi:sortase A